ncbi:MAG: aminotransferase class III-fold pyridoxal phosphate-dependent enzyme [Gemmatimonadetes bacterium]|nr:aminotransferase class III-fold pyridoxal phosphate-dependent enzyme [Gemmatimonadota bacterium]
MSDVQTRRPAFTPEEVIALAAERYGLTATATTLPSYMDQNFRLTDAGGRQFVFKISNGTESSDVLRLESAALARLHSASPPIGCPKVIPATTGEELWTIEGADDSHLVRLLSYLPGQLLADVPSHSPALLASIGRLLGRVDRALDGFDHPGATRTLEWDLRHAANTVATRIDAVEPGESRQLVDDAMLHFAEVAEPAFDVLRHSVIHGDGNDYNLIVGGDPAPAPTVVGIIDLGDLVWSATVTEVAIAAAYALMGKADPLAAMARVVEGYHAEYPLSEKDIEVLFALIRGRLSVCVTMAAWQVQQGRTDAYLTVSQAPAWKALRRLAAIDPDLVHYRLRAACGLVPCPAGVAVADWLASPDRKFAPVLGPGVDLTRRVVLDLGPGSEDIERLDTLNDVAVWRGKIADQIDRAGADIAVGRYDEPRLCYTGEQFTGQDTDEWRTVHLGIDLFAPAGTPVHAPFASRVHSVRNNDLDLDYGPTIILEHEPAPGIHCYTLYGHLSEASLEMDEGSLVEAGARIGWLGDPSENGGWPPHLHCQIITDLVGHSGNFPGVAAPSQRALWRSLSPDPGPMLGISGASGPALDYSTADIKASRERHVGPSLSLAYHAPLEIVRGWRQFLYDENGQPYLDCVNNVCQVGHCHPRVVAAASRQAAVLNTNTRYLHPNLTTYAQRLAALFPDPLSVCYLVNSGSEANELALRLARAHTGARDVIVLEHAYHGNTGALVDLSPYKHNGPGGSGAPDWVHVVPLPDPYRGPHRGSGAGRAYADEVARIIERTVDGGQRIAAFLAESASGCGGQVLLAEGYLAAAFAHVRRAGGVCIADEIQVGFGRAGTHMWMFQTQGVVPDIVTLGKPIGNGHPLGAVITTPEIAASFDSGMEYFNTFGGNPVSCAVGLAVLDVIEEQGLRQHAATVGAHFLDRLRELADRHAWIGDVRGRGLFIGVELVRDRDTLEPADREAAYVIERMKEERILLSTDGPYHNVLKIKPPLVFTERDAERVATTLNRILSEIV